jgi:membrane fusion protein (multidrug efflux system)
MTRRFLTVILGAAAFVAVLGAVKVHQIRTAIANAASFQPPPEAVTTLVAPEAQFPAVLKSIGTVAAAQGVTVAADLPGIVSEIAFESGKPVRAGDLLVRLDTRQEKAQLAAAVAQQELARLNLDRFSGLLPKGVVSRAEYDRTVAENKQAVARVAEIQATIERKEIRAPFSGVLGIRQVNLGQYLTGGSPVVALQSMDPIYVNFAVPQQQVGPLGIGGELRVTVEGAQGHEAVGRITALDSVVDEATRNVHIQATFSNPEGRLRPGMFVEAYAKAGEAEQAIALPASAISYAPYGDSVFVVETLRGPKGETYKGVRQHFVKLGSARGDQVAILSGIKAGDEVVSSGVFKLRNGAAVQVNNDVRPANDPAPKPEDN